MRQIASIACFIVLAASCGSTTTTVSPGESVTTSTNGAGTSTTTVPTTEPIEQPATIRPVEHEPEPTLDCRPDPFEFPPVDLDAVEYLNPFGLMTGSHVTPVDHQYFQNFREPERQIDVYAPSDGRVRSIQRFGTPVSENPTGVVDDYYLVIEHTCTVSSVFIHITELSAPLQQEAPEIGQYSSVDIPVEAGEKIGWFTKNVDYNVVDLDFETDGLVDPSSYQREPWKIHVPDTFDYFVPELSDQMRSMSLRTTEPRGGVFTHDIDGRLVGNWFEEGTNGYGGVNQQRYWAGHLSFAYDHIDPSMVMISIGTFVDVSRQFAVAGNAPDPASITPETGAVIYELVEWDYWVGENRWDRMSLAEGIQARPGDGVLGSVLVQLVDDRTLMMEIFPGVSRDGVSDFTTEAKHFTR